MAELIAHMESTSLDNDSIARKMVELANALGSVKGKNSMDICLKVERTSGRYH